MKNLLIYINPRKDFDLETSSLVKVQIDNSLELGWKAEDILLVTNFPYEYGGVKAIEVGDENYCEHFKQASKIYTIVTLFDMGLIKDLTWFHDFDVYQIDELTPDMTGVDLALSDYGGITKWNTGSFFFTPNAEDIFRKLKDVVATQLTDEERGLKQLTNNEIKGRVRKLNVSYNFSAGTYKKSPERAEHPIRALHFHPINSLANKGIVEEMMASPFMPDKLTNLFNKHGL